MACSFYLFKQLARGYSLDIDEVMVLKAFESPHSIGGILPVHGNINSQGVYNPPMHAYLYLFTNSIFYKFPGLVCLIPALLLHSAASFCLYLIARAEWGSRVAFTLFILYWFLGKADYYTSSSWAQGVLPALYTLFFYCSYKWIRGQGRYFFAGASFIASFAFGVHLSAALMVITHLGYIVFYRKQFPPLKVIFISGILALSIWVPFIVFEAEHGFRDIFLFAGNEEKVSIKEVVWTFFEFLREMYIRVVGFISYNIRNSNIPDGGFLSICSLCLFRFISIAGIILLLKTVLSSIKTRSFGHFSVLFTLFLLIPLFVQNLTSFNPVNRMDLLMSYFVHVILIAGYALNMLVQKVKSPFIMNSALCLVLLIPVTNIVKHSNLGIREDWRKELSGVIAEVCSDDDSKECRVAYDLFWDGIPGWVQDLNKVSKEYYEGVDIDFYLRRIQGIENQLARIDAMNLLPDYIVVNAQIEDRDIEDRLGFDYILAANHSGINIFKRSSE
tara:strand:- start:1275 stop:2777 length:1503 start_codon:yes stop_codon:yes gene_type:complete